MKKVLPFFLLFIANIAFAQDDTFFGLRFKEKYTTEQIVDAVGKDLFINIGKENKDDIVNTYFFRDVTFNQENYPLVSVQTLKDGELVCCSFLYTTLDKVKNKVDYEEKYLELKDSLCRKYAMEPVHTDEQALIRLYYDGVILPSVKLDKYVENGITTTIELSYISTLSYTLAIMKNSIDRLPTIQDSFFGMKFCTKQDAASMKAAIGARGKFEKTINACTEHIFSKVDFAGQTWDFASVITNREGLFYTFSVYDTYDNYSLNEQKRADHTYNYIKSILDEKYGAGAEKEKIEEDNRTIVYSGKNMVVIILSNQISKSAGGTYRRYVTLTYVQNEISEEFSQNAKNEL